MPSFTRRAPARTGGARAFAAPSAPGTSSTTSALAAPPPPSSVSTGIGSLDDIISTFSPGSTLLLLAPDAHTAWSRLVARHIASQGLLEGGRVVVASGDPGAWVKGMVWVNEDADKGRDKEEAGDGPVDPKEVDTNERGYADRRIAWRYDSLTFETTVGITALDASKTLPAGLRARAEAEGRLVQIAFDSDDGGMQCLSDVALALDKPFDGVARVAVEISPEQEFSTAGLVRFLLALRALLRPRRAVGVITLPPRLSSPQTSTPEWINTLSHAADATITLAGFGTNPLAAAYAPAHGLLTPHSLPSRGHVLAPALRHSTLLGVAGGSEQNLGFRLKRRKWVVETVHLGIEGGSGERRTEPVRKVVDTVPAGPTEGVEGVVSGVEPVRAETTPAAEPKAKEKKPRARVRFGDDIEVSHDLGHDHSGCGHGSSKPTPKIAMRHDKPELYEF